MNDNKEEIFITDGGELVVGEMSTNGTGMLFRRLRPGDYIGEIPTEDLKSIGKFELSY